MIRPRFLTIASILCLVTVVSSNQPKATTENGVVVGTYKTSFSGVTYRSFEGIPYAKPPVYEYRFKEPQLLEKRWVGEWNATQPGSPCLQYSHFDKIVNDDGSIEYGVVGDEDCLFINVYTQDKDAINKDVIVYIHGGAFMFGSGDRYSPHYLMDHDHGIVYVTFNYRLGPLGFLSTGDSIVPGNNGLKDQVAALTWIQRNIAGFGGDPNKVTIIGLSAGGASVHYMYLSSLSNNLFNRGYSYSGTALCPWALVNDAPQKTKHLAGLLGCPTTDSKVTVKCLRRRPARQIVQQMKNFQVWLYNPFTIFGPVVEVGSTKPFIDQHPRDIIKEGKAKDLPWINSVVSEEGLYPGAEFVGDDSLLAELNENWDTLASSLLFFNDTYPQRNLAQISQKIKELYLENKEISRKTSKELVQMISDRLFVAPAVEAAQLHVQQATQPVYFYKFSFLNDKSLSKYLSNSEEIFGVCHADDMSYVIKVFTFESRVSEADKKISSVLDDILLTFVKSGRVPKNFSWAPVSSTEEFQYLEISSPEKIEMKTGPLGIINELQQIFPKDYGGLKDEL